MAIKRIEILGVPVDFVPPQDIEELVMELVSKPGTKQIVLLNIWDLIKASRKKTRNELAECIKNADLVLPVSKSILKAAKKLRLQVPVRYNPFHLTVQILNALELHYKSVYLLGSHKKTLMAAEKNVRNTFKNLHVVGRYVGYYPKNVEDDVIQAIHKASPSLVLYGEGIKEKELWAYRRRSQFDSGIYLYYRDAIEIFGERKQRIPDRTFESGTEMWGEIVRNPFKMFLIFPYIGFCFRVLFSKKSR